MLFLRNTSNQGKKIINRFGKGIFSKATNSQFNFKKNYPNISINFNNSVFSRKFSTGNQINEKESIDLVESGVFEVLKSAQKLKHEKLNRTASFEELGNILFIKSKGFDSLDQVELVIAMEEKFGLEITGKIVF